MRKFLYAFALGLIASLLLVASAGAQNKIPRVKAVGSSTSVGPGYARMLVYGRTDDAATQQMLKYFQASAIPLQTAGTLVVACLEDANPSDSGFAAMVQSRGWGSLCFAPGDGSLQANLAAIGQNGRAPCPAVFTVDAQGYIVDYAAGNLSVSQKDAAMKSALSVGKNAVIAIDPTKKTMNKGKTFSFKPKITPKLSGKFITYASDNASVVKVSQSGKVKAVGYGKATVTARFGGTEAVCEVNVTAPLKKINLAQKTLTLNQGDTYELAIASVEPFNAEVDLSTAEWSSKSPKVAMVRDGEITAVSGGTAKITVKIGSKSATCTVKVLPDLSSMPLVAQCHELINAERAKKGLVELKNYAPLESAAKIRAVEIVQRFEHVRPDGSSCFSVVTYPASYGGENIAKGFSTAQGVVDGWMNSAGHKKNILNPNYRESGIGLYEYNNTLYWVQMFTKKK